MESATGAKVEETFRLADRVNRISVSPTMVVLAGGGRAEIEGRGRRRFRRGRAGFSDARTHQARRDSGARRKSHEIHAYAGHRCAAPGDLRLARGAAWLFLSAG